jgi:predicted GIY-YIG superfamily endonuclease
VTVVAVLLVVVGCAAAGVGWWFVDQLVALHVFHSTHVVYFLTDRQGAVLYVGSTDDIDRRYDEHTAADETSLEPWRRRICGIAPVRQCRSQRQARRIERRMIRALVVAGERGMCPRLKNEIYAGRPSALGRPWRAMWVAVYWLNGCLFPLCRWHRPNPAPRQPVMARVDEWEDWGASPLHDDEVVDAEIVSDDAGQHVSMIALPPFRGAADPADADASADSPADNVVSFSDRVRASHHRHVDDTRTAGPGDADARAARRREQNRQAQARARARKKATR